MIKMLLLRHQLWMPIKLICLKIILFLLHCSEKPTFLCSFISTCEIIWPPAPFRSCYLARNMKEVARACSKGYTFRPATEDYLICHTGNLALRVDVVSPAARTADLYLLCVYRSLCVLPVQPACRGASMRWIQHCMSIQ